MKRLARCWTKRTGTPLVVTMWQPQMWRNGWWYVAQTTALKEKRRDQHARADVLREQGA